MCVSVCGKCVYKWVCKYVWMYNSLHTCTCLYIGIDRCNIILDNYFKFNYGPLKLKSIRKIFNKIYYENFQNWYNYNVFYMIQKREREIQQQLELHEEDNIEVQGNYQSLHDEASIREKKLKKVNCTPVSNHISLVYIYIYIIPIPIALFLVPIHSNSSLLFPSFLSLYSSPLFYSSSLFPFLIPILFLIPIPFLIPILIPHPYSHSSSLFPFLIPFLIPIPIPHPYSHSSSLFSFLISISIPHPSSHSSSSFLFLIHILIPPPYSHSLSLFPFLIPILFLIPFPIPIPHRYSHSLSLFPFLCPIPVTKEVRNSSDRNIWLSWWTNKKKRRSYKRIRRIRKTNEITNSNNW